MSKQVFYDKAKDIFFENKVVILFAVICFFAFYHSGMSTVIFFNELFTRFGRNTFMVLALLIPVVAGLGLNFGIVLGAMAAQIAVFLVVLWGGSGFTGIVAIVALATPIAIVFGYLVGRMFNSMKGSEMIGGMVTALFADGFYQFFFLFLMGGIIPIANTRLMTPTGVGVLNAINLGEDPVFMRQVIDNVSMLSILNVAFILSVAFTVILLIFKLVKKQPIKLHGQDGMIKPLSLLIPLTILYILSFVVEPFLFFLYQDRLNGLVGVRLAAIFMILFYAYQIVRFKYIKKHAEWPVKPVMLLAVAVLMYLITLHTGIYSGLERVGIPVFTYMLIAALCIFIKRFMNTRLGQNMRTVGQNRGVATAAGINVDRTRIIAMIMSTVLAAYGQIIILQNFGVMATYGAHTQVGLYAIAALLVGGATVSKASVKHAIMGVLLFHSLFILAPMASANLMGSALIGEYFRFFAANAVIALALIMHAWTRVKRKKKDTDTKSVAA
ncbi:MAG: ABC transporter permease [Defluviitaleaceae bacterium]|nr:ABC transporter permease [Defluviitaleaceae bacterium]